MGRGGEEANKVLQPAQSVRLRASIIESVAGILTKTFSDHQPTLFF